LRQHSSLDLHEEFIVDGYEKSKVSLSAAISGEDEDGEAVGDGTVQ
jgi:hypothetical protein